MASRICECGREIDPDSRHDICFRCKVQGLQFLHPKGGWDAWRTGPTVREQVKDITDTAKASGKELTYKGKAHF